MKKLLTTLIFTILLGSNLNAQEDVEIILENGYVKTAYFVIDPITEEYSIEYRDYDAWDLAFEVGFSTSVRINTPKGLKLFWNSELSHEDWDEEILASDIESDDWQEYFNSDQNWRIGALNLGKDGYEAGDFGWGEYSQGQGVYGKTFFVIQFQDFSFKKFMIERMSGQTYYIKFADLDGSNEVSRELATANKTGRFAFFSFDDSEELFSYEANDFALVFGKYSTFISAMNMQYTVTGALQSSNYIVEEVHDKDPGEAHFTEDNFSGIINTVGYDWKVFNGSSYDLTPNLSYFMTKADWSSTIVHHFFFSEFDPGNGKIVMSFGRVYISVDESNNNNSGFGIYPNMISRGESVNFIFKEETNTNAEIVIYDMNGNRVYSKAINTNGFDNFNSGDLNLASGMYNVLYLNGKSSLSQKLIVK